MAYQEGSASRHCIPGSARAHLPEDTRGLELDLDLELEFELEVELESQLRVDHELELELVLELELITEARTGRLAPRAEVGA